MRFGYIIIFVDDVAEAVDFYELAFGIEREFVHEAGDFAQMSTGETKLAFTSHALGATAVPVEYTPFDPSRSPAGVELTLITDDVAADFTAAVAAGALPLAEPHDTEWGQIVSYVVEDAPVDELLELVDESDRLVLESLPKRRRTSPLRHPRRHENPSARPQVTNPNPHNRGCNRAGASAARR